MVGNRVLGFLLVLSVTEWSRITVAAEIRKCHNHRVLGSGVPCELKNKILKIHNEYRQQIANGNGIVSGWLKASNMREMYWDDELERKAQQLTDSCILHHDNIIKNYDDRFEVSQFIVHIHNNAKNRDRKDRGYPKRIEKWLADERHKPLHHLYSPRINAETYLVGCGHTRYQYSSVRAKSFYVCNYGPAPVKGNEPYEMGEPASLCPSPLINSTKYPGLCSMEVPPVPQCNDTALVYYDEQMPEGSDTDSSGKSYNLEEFESTNGSEENNDLTNGSKGSRKKDKNGLDRSLNGDNNNNNDELGTELKDAINNNNNNNGIETQNTNNQPLTQTGPNGIYNVQANSIAHDIIDKTFQQLKSNISKINNVITINVFE